MDKAKEKYIASIGRSLLKEIFVPNIPTSTSPYPITFEDKVDYLRNKTGG